MTLRLTEDEQTSLRALAKREGVSMQDVARRALHEYFVKSEHQARVAVAASKVMAAHSDALRRLGE